MNARHVLTPLVRFFDQRDDLVEVHRCGVANQCACGSRCHDLLGHERSGVKANRTALNQAQAAHGDEIRRTGTGSNEMDRHSAASAAMRVPSFALYPRGV